MGYFQGEAGRASRSRPHPDLFKVEKLYLIN